MLNQWNCSIWFLRIQALLPQIVALMAALPSVYYPKGLQCPDPNSRRYGQAFQQPHEHFSVAMGYIELDSHQEIAGKIQMKEKYIRPANDSRDSPRAMSYDQMEGRQ